jgi:hypothetical protein
MAQFSVVPPLKEIAILFKAVTGLDCDVDVTWSSWSVTDLVEILEDLRPYYRPCHTKILDETASGLYKGPSRLLRQLLRPHGLNIQARNGSWKLVKMDTGIKIDTGQIGIIWEGPGSCQN